MINKMAVFNDQWFAHFICSFSLHIMYCKCRRGCVYYWHIWPQKGVFKYITTWRGMLSKKKHFCCLGSTTCYLHIHKALDTTQRCTLEVSKQYRKEKNFGKRNEFAFVISWSDLPLCHEWAYQASLVAWDSWIPACHFFGMVRRFWYFAQPHYISTSGIWALLKGHKKFSIKPFMFSLVSYSLDMYSLCKKSLFVLLSLLEAAVLRERVFGFVFVRVHVFVSLCVQCLCFCTVETF